MLNDSVVKKMLLGSIVLAMALITFGQKVEQNLNLLPYPKEVVIGQGGFLGFGKVEVLIRYPNLEKESTNIKEQLVALFPDNGLKWVDREDVHIFFSLKKEGLSSESLNEHDEAYCLKVHERRMEVVANSEKGLFYAVQTIKQLLNSRINQGVPSMVIKDFPAFDHRGLMDDISRGPLPTLAFMKRQVIRLSELKYNKFTFYIEHVIKTNKHGSFAPNEGITLKELEELSDFAALHNMELIGTFQSLGHFEKILAFPQYADLGVTARMLRPGDDQALTFLKEVYDEMIPAFNSAYFNINSDEAWDLSRGELQVLADSIGVGKIYTNHVNPLLDHLIGREKKPMIWGDILLEHPETLDDLPNETTILTWDYSNRDDFSDWIDPIAGKNLDFWVCPGVLNSNRFMPNFDEALGNIRGFVNEGLDKGAKGVLLTVWDDGGRHFFSRDWYGVAYGAEQSWNTNEWDFESYKRRFSLIFYEDRNRDFNTMIDELLSLGKLSVMPSMNNGSLNKSIFPNRNVSLSFNGQHWQEVRDGVEEASKRLAAWSVQSGDSWDVAFWRFTINQIGLLAESRLKMIELAKSYESSCLQQSNTEVVTLNLVRIEQDLDDLLNQWTRLYEEFQLLWQLENRRYWTDEANAVYETHIEDLSALRKRFLEAKSSFDPRSARFLPTPRSVGLDVKDERSTYFNFWLITGPFAITDYEQEVKLDFLEMMGGESGAQPIPGFLYQDLKGQSRYWKKVGSSYTDRIVFTDLFDIKEKAVAYAYCRINAPRNMTLDASFGSNDGIVLFLNGVEIFRKNEKRSLIKDEDQASLQLVKGTNHLLVKVDQWKGAWEFSFRLPDVQWKAHKHKYTILE